MAGMVCGMQVPIKVHVERKGGERECRRVLLLDPQLADVMSLAERWAHAPCLLQYTDEDGDTVTVGTEDEWHECLSVWHARGGSVLRLRAVRATPGESLAAPHGSWQADEAPLSADARGRATPHALAADGAGASGADTLLAEADAAAGADAASGAPGVSCDALAGEDAAAGRRCRQRGAGGRRRYTMLRPCVGCGGVMTAARQFCCRGCKAGATHTSKCIIPVADALPVARADVPDGDCRQEGIGSFGSHAHSQQGGRPADTPPERSSAVGQCIAELKAMGFKVDDAVRALVWHRKGDTAAVVAALL